MKLIYRGLLKHGQASGFADFVEAVDGPDAGVFLCNGDQHRCTPQSDCIFTADSRWFPERLDAQVLLDPFEEQLDFPALSVQVCNQLGFQGKVVGQNVMRFPRFVLTTTRRQSRRIVLLLLE